jgi:hypothetical protein
MNLDNFLEYIKISKEILKKITLLNHDLVKNKNYFIKL